MTILEKVRDRIYHEKESMRLLVAFNNVAMLAAQEAERLAKQELIREISNIGFVKDPPITVSKGDIVIFKREWQSLKKKHGVE